MLEISVIPFSNVSPAIFYLSLCCATFIVFLWIALSENNK